jgi:hypothetical protein
LTIGALPVSRKLAEGCSEVGEQGVGGGDGGGGGVLAGLDPVVR